jgi:hypothetical protein
LKISTKAVENSVESGAIYAFVASSFERFSELHHSRAKTVVISRTERRFRSDGLYCRQGVG